MLQGTSDDIQKWKRYEFLFEGTKDMIFYFSSDGKVIECNSSAYEQLGFEPGETIWMQHILRTCSKIDDGYIVIQNEKIDQYFETSIYRKNQTCFPVQARISLLYGEEKVNGEGVFGVCRACSILQQNQAERELVFAKEGIEEAHKERNEFVANVTHELRTPVNGIMGLAQTLMDTQLTGEQRETVELIDHCCKNMIKIINNILDFSKLQAGKFTIESREFNFLEMMNALVKTNQPVIEEKGLHLVCNVSSDIPERVIGDELRLTQVLNNLLSNAVKFTSIGQIVVNVIKSMDLPDEMELFFMVIDSGIGIAESEKDKLFKSFSQVDASITRKYGGTGLGLSIVKDLVHMMGGEINVESEEGKGSTFSFSIRVKKVDSLQKEDETERKEFSFHLGNITEEDSDTSAVFRLGSPENLKEIQNNMEKLVLCIEMENWERANAFADNVKQLVSEDAMNLKRKAFRLQMTVRKGDYDTAMQQYEELKEAIAEMEKTCNS